MMMLALLTFLFLLPLTSCFTQLQLETDKYFTRMRLGPKDGNLYIAAVDRIYRVSSVNDSLKLDETLITGPYKSKDGLTSKNAYNQLLHVDHSRGRDTLVFCDTSNHDCQICDLHNFKQCLKHTPDIINPERILVRDEGVPIVSLITERGDLLIGQSVNYQKDEPASSPPEQGTTTTNLFSLTNLTNPNAFKMIKSLGPGPGISNRYYEFVSVFNAYDFTYFVNNLKKGSNVKTLTIKCRKDDAFKTLLAYSLNCNGDKLTHAHFTRIGSHLAKKTGVASGDIPNTDAILAVGTSRDSDVVCLFPLVSVQKMALESLESCAEGKGTTEMSYWAADFNGCLQQRPTKNTCDSRSPGGNIRGAASLDANRVLHKSNKRITAIASKEVNGQTVLYMGTEEGNIVKYWVDKDIEFEKVGKIDNSPVLPDMMLDVTGHYLFALTKNKVVKLRLTDCAKYKTCATCSGSSNPHCGWCTHTAKCTEKSRCANSAKTNHWLQATETCIAITSVTPTAFIHVNDALPKLILQVAKLPTELPNEVYKCRFNVGTNTCTIPSEVVGRMTIYTSDAVRTNDTIRCDVPGQIKRVMGSVGIMKACVDVSSSVSGGAMTPIVIHSLIFIECTKITKCTECTRENLRCYWNIYAQKCKSTTSAFVANNTAECPMVLKQSRPNLIPSGILSNVSLHGRNLKMPRNDSERYTCAIETDVTNIPASPAKWISTSLVVCLNQMISYKDKTKKFATNTRLRWQNNDIEKEAMSDVVLYKCEYLSADCTTCSQQYSVAPYNCMWCKSRRCAYAENPNCEKLNVCPKPNITEVSPRYIAIDSNTTIITISGINLVINQLRTTVTLGNNLNCAINESASTVSKQIVCLADMSPTETTGHVTVKTDGQSTTYTAHEISYVTPKITKVDPNLGPLSGGTIVNVTGQYLSIGEEQSVWVKSGVECTILNDTLMLNSLLCKTEKTNETSTSFVELRIDNTKPFTSVKFEFVADPILLSVSPLKSIQSGGRNITVKGDNFHAIQTPKIFLVPDTENAQACTKHSRTRLSCPSPPFTSTRRRRSLITPNDRSLGFVMDGVMSVQNPRNSFPNATFTILYTRDPVFYNFSDVMKFNPDKQEHLTIEGEAMDLALRPDEVEVTIGGKKCLVKSLLSDELLCVPPKESEISEEIKESDGEDGFHVYVNVGPLEFYIGRVRYITVPVNAIIYAVPIAIIALLVIIIVIIVVVFRRRNLKNIADVRNLEIEMEQREEKIAGEVRAEFAALQKDMCLVTEDLVELGIPYRSITSFMFGVLFPAEDPSDHPLLDHTSTVCVTHDLKEQLGALNNLLTNRFFLIPVIRKLDHCSVTPKEKSYVSALLTLCLFPCQDTFIRILKDVITEMVSDAADRKQTKQIMRRNETIVENLLSNWLYTSIYENLKDKTGYSVFLLYKAVSQVTDYGPVDAVTCDAHYTLSEENLLKEVIETKTINVRVLYNGTEYHCSVLDSDSVTQAKNKFIHFIFKNTPASACPSAYDLELEWRAGHAGHLPLQDFDNSCMIDGDWKMVNTLRHYCVPDDALFALIAQDSDNIEKHNYENLLVSPAAQSVSPTNSDDVLLSFDKRDYKICHHVRRECDMAESERRKIPEIYLTRLISTKVALKKSIDEFFETVFSPNNVPESVRYLFQFLDGLAKENDIDRETTHSWKSNCLPRRIWASLLCNPQLILDVNKPEVAEPSLLVISQCLIDACSLASAKVSKGSPSTKLLFHKDLVQYRPMVQTFYSAISSQEPVSDQSLIADLSQLSRELESGPGFNMVAVNYNIYKFLARYENKIADELSGDFDANRLKLDEKFSDVMEEIKSLGGEA